MSEQVSLDVFDVQCKKLEEKMAYRVQRESERVKQQMELMVKDLGQSIVDCLKRRDQQLEQRFQILSPNSSTPRENKCSSKCTHSPIHNTTSVFI